MIRVVLQWLAGFAVAASMLMPFYNVVQSPICDGFQGVSVQLDRYLWIMSRTNGIVRHLLLFLFMLVPFVWPLALLVAHTFLKVPSRPTFFRLVAYLLAVGSILVWVIPILASLMFPNRDPHCPGGRWHPLYGYFSAAVALFVYVMACPKNEQPNQAL